MEHSRYNYAQDRLLLIILNECAIFVIHQSQKQNPTINK